MKKIKGFEYYIDTEGNLYREYLKGYKKITKEIGMTLIITRGD